VPTYVSTLNMNGAYSTGRSGTILPGGIETEEAHVCVSEGSSDYRTARMANWVFSAEGRNYRICIGSARPDAFADVRLSEGLSAMGERIVLYNSIKPPLGFSM
jgi:hypothetical protein